MPNVMAALPNMGDALCSTLQFGSHPLLVPYSNAGKTQKPLKFARVPQTTGLISAASGPKFTILSGHVEEILPLNSFFPSLNTCPNCEDIARQSCAMVPDGGFFGDFLHSEFSVSRVQQVSDLRLKFAIRPHHVCKCDGHPVCNH